jgi:hypothetical protein
VTLSGLILVAWFPVSDLLQQHEQLASATSQLDHVRQQDAALAKQAARLKTPAEITRLAQQQDQLVQPGQQAYQVLPPSSASGTGGTGTATSPASAGSTATTRPSSASTTNSTTTSTPATGTGTNSDGAATHGDGTGPDFISRVVRTLEFWR